MKDLRGDALVDALLAIPRADRDRIVDDVFGFAPPPPDVELPRGAVPYLPCGVDEIVAMVRAVPIRAHDDFVDLGAGLGRVAILVNLLCGARATGIEIQEPLVDAARARAAALAIDVAFECANVADTALDGSVVFLYAPFNGELLARVLDRIRAITARRPIVVCTVDLVLDVPWLVPRPSDELSLAIYDSRH